MESTDEYRKKNPLSDQLYKKFQDSLGPYETSLKNYRRAVKRGRTIEEDTAAVKENLESLLSLPIYPDDAPYLKHCLEMLKKLEFSNILNSVLYADLSSLYLKHGQTYREQVNYRHTLYLKLLICALYFRPLMHPDTLICIDEAQDISAAEYDLLRSILGSECAFNLYGDVNQRIYRGRGVADWPDISWVTQDKVFRLDQNYRNTNQITEYCNQNLHTNMDAIGISGEEVQELDLDHAAQWILTLREQKPDFRLAIIHPFRSAQVRKQLSALLDQDCLTWNSMETGKISVLTIEAAKGLEFEGVLALTDQMTPNEQYVAFTRALECLAVVKDPVVSKDKTAAKTISGASDETDQLSEFD